MKLVILTCVGIFMCLLEAKKFKKCEFARIARDNGLTNIATWTCIAFHESRLNSKAKSGNFYGILQISGEYWCGVGKRCGISCESLLDSDLTDDLNCAKKIYNSSARLPGRDGFSPWSSSHYCKGNQEKWLKECLS